MTFYSEGWHAIAILVIFWNQKATFKRRYIVTYLILTRLIDMLTFDIW